MYCSSHHRSIGIYLKRRKYLFEEARYFIQPENFIKNCHIIRNCQHFEKSTIYKIIIKKLNKKVLGGRRANGFKRETKKGKKVVGGGGLVVLGKNK